MRYNETQWNRKNNDKIQCDILRSNEIQWDAVRYRDAVRYSEIQWHTTRYNEIHKCSEIQWDAVRYNEIRWDTLRYNEEQWDWDRGRWWNRWEISGIQWDTMRYSEIQWDTKSASRCFQLFSNVFKCLHMRPDAFLSLSQLLVTNQLETHKQVSFDWTFNYGT